LDFNAIESPNAWPSIEVARMLNYTDEEIWLIAAQIGRIDLIPRHYLRKVFYPKSHISVLRKIIRTFPYLKFEHIKDLRDYDRAKLIIDRKGISKDNAIEIIRYASDLKLVNYLIHKAHIKKIDKFINNADTFMYLYNRKIIMPLNENIRTIKCLPLSDIVKLIRDNFNRDFVLSIYRETYQEDVATYLLEKYGHFIDLDPYIFKFSLKTVTTYLKRDFTYNDVISACRYNNVTLARYISETHNYTIHRDDLDDIFMWCDLPMIKWLLTLFPNDFAHCYMDDSILFYILLHHKVDNMQALYEFVFDGFVRGYNFNAALWMYRQFPEMKITKDMFELLIEYPKMNCITQKLKSQFDDSSS
jgi:hypothetical protein